MRPALVIAGAGLVAFLVYLLLPQGAVALVGFEVLVVVVAWLAIRRIVPRNQPAQTTGLPFVPFWQRSRWETEPMLPLSLRRVEGVIRYSERHPFAVHQRLLPLLRELAAERLAAIHGVAMEQDEDEAARLLGSDAWEILGPHAAEVPERAKHGISHEAIDTAVSAIEGL
jgi:hypothetical protein